MGFLSGVWGVRTLTLLAPIDKTIDATMGLSEDKNTLNVSNTYHTNYVFIFRFG